LIFLLYRQEDTKAEGDNTVEGRESMRRRKYKERKARIKRKETREKRESIDNFGNLGRANFGQFCL